MKALKKSLSVILAVIMIFTTFSVAMPVFAAGNIFANEDAVKDLCKQEITSKLVNEVTELREANEKHFICEDGSYVVATYSSPVHYFEDGIWKEFDNRFVPVSKNIFNVSATEYTTKAGPGFIVVPKNFSDNQKIKLTNDGYTIKLGTRQVENVNSNKNLTVVDDIKKLSSVKNNSVDTNVKNIENEEKLLVKNQTGAVVYRDIFDDTDLEYIASSDNIKENIVVNKPQHAYTYSFEIDFGELIPVVQDDNSINVVKPDNENETVFFIAAPYMYDANNVESTNIEVSLKKDNESYIYTISADSGWINSSERSFPVVIDPTVYMSYNDVFVENGAYANATRAIKEIRVGRNLTNLTRTYIKPTIPSNIPFGSYINSAYLRLTNKYYYSAPSASNININAYDCCNVSSWNTGNINWNNQPIDNSNNGYNNSNAILLSSVAASSSKTSYSFNITDAVGRWYSTGNNNGIMLASSNESTKTQIDFYSSRASDSSNKPQLVISYSNPEVGMSEWSTDYVAKGSSSFDIKTGKVWTAYSNVDWISLESSSGVGYTSNKIYVSENTSVRKRTGTVTINVGSTVLKTINVTQYGADHVAPSMPYLYEEDGLVYILSTSFNFNEETDSPETLQYKLGNGNWVDYTEPLEIVNTTDTTVYARTIDEANNTSLINSITVSSTLGQYNFTNTDIVLGDGILPVDFTRSYSSNTGWFFSFNANITSYGIDGYIFTDFNGNKNYYLKNGDNEYVNAYDEKLVVNNNSYILDYGNYKICFNENGKLSSVEKNNVLTNYIWNNNSLVIGGIATVTFNSASQPTGITITKAKDGITYSKSVSYNYTNGDLSKFTDAVGIVYNYSYTNGKLTNNNGEIISYIGNRVQKITQRNNAFIKYEYEDNAQNPDCDENVNIGRVKISDSKGVTDYVYYSDGLYVSNSLLSYSDNAIYNPNNISNETITNDISNVYYVVSDPLLYEENYSENEAFSDIVSVDEYPLYKTDCDGNYTFFKYDESHRIIKELQVNSSSISINDNTTFEVAEIVAETKTEYDYDDCNNIVGDRTYERIFNNLRLTYSEASTYSNNKLNHLEKISIKYTQSETEILSETKTQTIDYEYDVWNQCIRITENADTVNEKTSTYSYDKIGRKVQTIENGQSVAYIYIMDKLSRVNINGETIEYCYQVNGDVYSIEKPNDESMTYLYDNFGNLRFQLYNRSYSIQYNTLGNVVAMYSRFDEATNNRLQRVEYTYSQNFEQNITRTHFNSGDNIDYIYDDEGRKVGIKLNNTLKYEFSYSDDTAEIPQTINDHINNTYKVIDENKIELFDANNNLLFSISNDIDDTTFTNNKNVFVNNGYSYNVVSNNDSDTFKSTSNSGATEFVESYVYDGFDNSKLNSVSIGTVLNSSFEYNTNGNISSITNLLNNENQDFAYTYDNTGRVIAVVDTSGGVSDNTHYTYENGYLTVVENDTTKWVYTYDESGNIIAKKEYAVVDNNGSKEYNLKPNGTDNYVYRNDWKEELSSFNGQNFSYDGSGNPIVYRNHNLTWTFGRQLASFDDITYTYDESGIRRSKTSNGTTTKYYTDSNNNVVYQSDGTTAITFYYDRNDNIVGFKYNGNNYFYVKNLQGDIVAITDSNGNDVVRYAYDPWGKIIDIDGNTTIGNLNPYRYRSYYYDTDTNLYYLQSRYYDPEICRFLNCDNINYIGTNFNAVSYNPFAYCKNDPVNYFDPMGNWSADIHYGRKYSNSKMKYYKNSKGKYLSYDGTYEWACSLGFKSKYADILANACRLVDRSAVYGPVIATSNGFGHHFNFSYSSHEEDSRLMFANKWLSKAVDMFKAATKMSKREKALKILGRGLHALQDYSAHGNFQPVEVIYLKNSTITGVTTSFLIQQHSKEYDNPFYDWKNDSTRCSFGSLLSKTGLRYEETQMSTLIYLTLFLIAIGNVNQKYICNA